jgi:hypothetical protein
MLGLSGFGCNHRLPEGAVLYPMGAPRAARYPIPLDASRRIACDASRAPAKSDIASRSCRNRGSPR